MRKQAFCICENKDADQLHGNCEADLCLCFRYKDSTIPLLSKSEISSLWPSSVAVQPGLCRPGRKPECWFSYDAAHISPTFSHHHHHHIRFRACFPLPRVGLFDKSSSKLY